MFCFLVLYVFFNPDIATKEVFLYDVFYANSYVQYKLQNKNVVYQLGSGVESNKLGAYIQNKLHDNFGLNPRFPWQVTRKNRAYVQGKIQSFINTL